MPMCCKGSAYCQCVPSHDFDAHTLRTFNHVCHCLTGHLQQTLDIQVVCSLYVCTHVHHMTTQSRQIDLEEYIRSRINQTIATDCRRLRPCRPSSTAYKTVLYTVDEGLYD